MIKLENVTFKYPEFELKDINLEIGSGEIVAITGNNASGKTTLAMLIAGLLKTKKGSIIIDDEPIQKATKKIGIVFQNPDTQIIFNNVYDDISFTLKNHGIRKDEFEERIDYALSLVDMKEFKNKEIFSMSAGQKQRIAIANMLAIKPDIIIFDEASVFLDTKTKQLLYRLFLSLKDQGITVIFATNLLEEIVFADKVVVMQNGKIKYFDSTKNLLRDLNFLRTLGFYIPLKLELIEKFKLYDTKFDDDLARIIGGAKK